MPDPSTAILLLAHGTPNRLSEMAEYLAHVTAGRPMPAHVVEELQHRYAAIGLREDPLPKARHSPAGRSVKATSLAIARQQGLRRHAQLASVHLRSRHADEVRRRHSRPVLCLAPQNSRTSTGLYRRALEKLCSKLPALPSPSTSSPAGLPSRCSLKPSPRILRLALTAARDADPSAPVLFTAHSVPCRTIMTPTNPGGPSSTGGSHRQAGCRSRPTAYRTTVLLPPPIPTPSSANRPPPPSPSSPASDDSEWFFAFQSQGVAGAPWIGPTVEDTLTALAAAGHKAVVIQPIGFLCDHVEILYDIDINFRDFAARSASSSFALPASTIRPPSSAPSPHVRRRRMKRIAIVGGGISGLTAAYELELARRAGADIDWQLYEAGDRFGGIIETTRSNRQTANSSSKAAPTAGSAKNPGPAISPSNSASKISSSTPTTQRAKPTSSSTAELQPIPDRMRLMVPKIYPRSRIPALLRRSPSGLRERTRQRRSAAAQRTQSKTSRSRPLSVAISIMKSCASSPRLFSPESSAAMSKPSASAPSCRSSSPWNASTARSSPRCRPRPPFAETSRPCPSSRRSAWSRLAHRRTCRQTSVRAVCISIPTSAKFPAPVSPAGCCALRSIPFAAAPIVSLLRSPRPRHVTRRDAPLLRPLDYAASDCLPKDASSAILTTFVWPADDAKSLTLPQGFGLLVPPVKSEGAGA